MHNSHRLSADSDKQLQTFTAINIKIKQFPWHTELWILICFLYLYVCIFFASIFLTESLHVLSIVTYIWFLCLHLPLLLHVSCIVFITASQGCQVFEKNAQFQNSKLAQSRFKGVYPIKNRIPGAK